MTTDDILRSLRQAFKRYPSVLANYNACKSRDGQEVVWRNYDRPWIPANLSFLSFLRLVDTQQYSFMTTDGAIFHLSYKFKGRHLLKASLAFFMPRVDPNSSVRINDGYDTISGTKQIEGYLNPDNDFDSERMEADDYEDYDVVEPSIDREIAWIRIDSDALSTKGLIHPFSHMHIDSYPEMRLPVRGVLTPIQFVDFIVSLVYPALCASKHLDSDGQPLDVSSFQDDNRNLFPIADAALLEAFIHLRVPGIINS